MKQGLRLTVFLLLVICIWQTVSSLSNIPSYILPSPKGVAVRLGELASDGLLWRSAKATLSRMFLGYSLSALIGVLAGMAMGLFQIVRDVSKSIFLGLQTLPSAAWVPISLLLFGLNDSAIYFVIIMSSVGGIAVAVADGIANIPPVMVRAAETLGTPKWAIGFRVIIPATLPSIVTGLKLGWTLGWHGAVSAELIKSTIGLGFLLHMGRELNDSAQVIGVMLCTILIGLSLDKAVFGPIEQKIRMRWGYA